MSVGLSFFRSLLENKEPITFLADFNLSKMDFADEEVEVLRFIRKYIKKYSKLPPLKSTEKITGIDLPEISDEPLDFWVDQVRNRSLTQQIRSKVQRIFSEISNGNFENVRPLIASLSAELIQGDSDRKIYTLRELANIVLDRHDERQKNNMLGNPVDVPFGFPYLDAVSGGMQKGDTVAIVGESGIGKTYILCRMAKAAHDAGYTVLFISMEMSDEQIARRLLALDTKINDSIIRRGQLQTVTGRPKLVKSIEGLEEKPPFYILDGKLVLGVDELDAYIRSLNPDAVYVDGAYMLHDGGRSNSRWETITEAAHKIKMISNSCFVPIAGTYQFNERREIYGARAIKFLASIIMYVLEDVQMDGDDVWSRDDSRVVELRKGRSGEKGKFSIIYDMDIPTIEEEEVISKKGPEPKLRKRRKI